LVLISHYLEDFNGVKINKITLASYTKNYSTKRGKGRKAHQSTAFNVPIGLVVEMKENVRAF